MWTLALLSCRQPEVAPAPVDPGRVTFHRLTRREYNATVRDLMGTTLQPADDFPADDFGYGFSNIADVLSTSPLHVELYELAADALITEIFPYGTEPTVTTTVEIETLSLTDGVDFYGWAWQLIDVGSIEVPFDVLSAGPTNVSLRAFATLAGDASPQVRLDIDGVEAAVFDVSAPEALPGTYSAVVDLTAGTHTATLTYLNEYRSSEDGDRNVMFDRVDATGPLDIAIAPSAGRALVVTCDPATLGEVPCAEEIVDGFASRAWRRPITAEEHTTLLGLYATARNLGSDWEEAIGVVLRAVLVDPRFTFKWEVDPEPESPTPRALTPWELASRLSYFLWSSIPDDRLRARAADGSLLRDDVLEGEVRRMLSDPKASALLDGLATEWLYTEVVAEAAPDPTLFPTFDEGLRSAMMTESRLFVADILLSDRSFLDLIDAEETWVDGRLAEHYGLAAPSGDGFAKVSTAGSGRKGLLSQGGLLTALSYPSRTSPIRRGKWVVGNLLCEAPAPPAITPEIEVQDTGSTEVLSLRQQMEQHREDPACASCHLVMDEIGFALEPFDAIGRPRTIDDFGAPIDATGTMPDGTPFEGVAELADILARDPKVPFCAAQNTFTYALQRPPRPHEVPTLDAIVTRFAEGGWRFADLAVGIALSDSFRYRVGDDATPATGEGEDSP